MEKKIITFTADEQSLRKTGGISNYSSNKVSYIEAEFELGENWQGFDAVRAIWYNKSEIIATVLSDGHCTVPYEVLTDKGQVKVNLVGSISENDVLTDRLTSYPTVAFIVDAEAKVNGSNTQPITPSQFEQFVEAVKEDADRAEQGASDAETYANNAETSADNALLYSQNAEGSAIRASGYALDASSSATSAEGYAQNASESATSAENYASDAEDARDEIRNMSANATTLPAGSSATASYSDGVLSLGIPRGDKGATGAKGDKGDTGATPNLTIGTVTTLDPSESATATITGTDENPVLNLGLPKGEQGEVSQAQLDAVVSDVKSDLNVIGEAVKQLVVSDNKFDNDFDQSGYINNGADASSSSFKRTSKFYDCTGWGSLYCVHSTGSRSGFVIVFYNSNKEFISNQGASGGGEKNVPSNAVYFRAYVDAETVASTYVSNIPASSPVNYSYTLETKIVEEALPDKLPEFTNDLSRIVISDNKFDKSLFDVSGYINNGADASSPSFVRTSKFYSINGWERINIESSESDTGITLVFYDSNKDFISNQGASNGLRLLPPPFGASCFRAYRNASATGDVYISYIEPSNPVNYTYTLEDKVGDGFSQVSLLMYDKVRLATERHLLSGLKIVNFGDSIIGNFQAKYGNEISVSELIAIQTNSECVNAGFGGCQMSEHNVSGWTPFSMYELADAIVDNDWTTQDASWADRVALNLPYYFGTTIATLKAIDFSKVDIITIEYGTNDWSAGKAIDNVNDAFDTSTFCGALRYTIRKMQTAYPSLKIVVQNPTPRIYMSDGEMTESSDTKTNTIGKTLVDYIEAEIEVCKEFKCPVIDAYYPTGFNGYNHDYYYNSASDDVHLGLNGRKRLSEIVANNLMNLY